MNNVFTTIISLLLVDSSCSNLLQRLDTRRLVEISFNDKYCVDYAPNNEWDWLAPYSGEYTYTGIENAKPSYTMTKCKTDSNCRNGAKLRANTNGNWQFTVSDGSDPTCNVITSTPTECTSWWGGRNPIITACGNTQTADNGKTQEQTDGENACIAVQKAETYCAFTSTDKDELLRQYNVQRKIYGQPDFVWSNVLESEALLSANRCGGNHCWSGDETAYAQGIGGGDNINYILWDGYRYGDCNGNKGLVWAFMQDAHGNPMRGLDAIKYTDVGCAYNCQYVYCNYR